ncbi:MAG: hypothetical protein J6S75_07995 [Thermoguttaceae bacterium]|nr:hypothetical protein [Thermoguttaceae bacterium]
MKSIRLALALLGLSVLLGAVSAAGAELYVGAKSIDITPDEPVVLAGQFHPRKSKGVVYPVTANVIAIEAREGDQPIDAAIIISIDTVVIRSEASVKFRDTVKAALPDFDIDKVLFSATHTHAAPVLSKTSYPRVEGTMAPEDYVEFLCGRLGPGVKSAWESRQKCEFSYGLGHAVVAYNRRAVYKDGHAEMYGNTNTPNFLAIEGVEDHDVGTIFFWRPGEAKPLAMIVNVSCPAQDIESDFYISSDYWGALRQYLCQEYGDDLVTVGLCGAAGDMSPHIRYRAAADARMRELRGLTGPEEIARRVLHGVDEAYEAVQKDRYSDVPFAHRFSVLELPKRLVTEEEARACMAEYEMVKDDPNDGRAEWNRRILRRYEDQKENPHPIFHPPLNVIRLGDCALCFAQFEVYTDFGIMVKARSKAVQTFTIQLTGGAREPMPSETESPEEFSDWAAASGGTYLPSRRAAAGGGYGAIIQSNTVGPEGGEVLVEETLKVIDDLWK